MRAIGELLSSHFVGPDGVQVLVQGQASKRELLERFCAAAAPGARGCVMVASASFWEGIDIAGDALQLLVIDKLPFSPPDDPPEETALYSLDEFVRDSIEGRDKWTSFYQPIMPLFHMCNMVNFILPKAHRPAFEGWLSGMAARLDQIATPPEMEVPDFDDFESEAAYDAYCAPKRGTALPPQVLDLDADLAGLDLQAAADTFLRGLDHKKNRFLLAPEKLIEMGFEGTPYGRAP